VQPYEIRLHHLDGCARVELIGEVDILAGETLREALRGLAFRYDADQVTIDCARLTFIDMSALGQLVSLTNRLAGGRPTIAGAPAFFARVLRLTDVIDRFTLEVEAGRLAEAPVSA